MSPSNADEPGSENLPEFPPELPPEIALLLPDQQQRDVAGLVYHLCTKPSFRDKFWYDPAGAMVDARLSADARTIEAVQNIDRAIVDQLVLEWREISRRSGALRFGDESAIEPRTVVAALLLMTFAAGVAAGALLAHGLRPRVVRKI